jgi:hypothetical protein
MNTLLLVLVLGVLAWVAYAVIHALITIRQVNLDIKRRRVAHQKEIEAQLEQIRNLKPGRNGTSLKADNSS